MSVTSTTSSTGIFYRRAGAGEPILLVHGWPQTGHCWRGVASELDGHYDVVVPDLRGLGQTVDNPDLGYAKRSIAVDLANLMTGLKIERFHLVGHDWGGVVAFMLAAYHSDRVATLTIVDVAVPSEASPLMSQGGRRWHHPFHQTAELPEALVSGREREYLGWFFDNYGASADAISPRDREEYLRWYRRPESLCAGFEYYRAFPQDVADAIAAPTLRMPVLAVGGADGWGRGTEVADSLRPLTSGEVTEVVLRGAGHWVPEEKPLELATAIREHVSRSPIRSGMTEERGASGS